tara:strand:- start:374 stop:1186 length:813 start_codon:yes stop_codon:yes gene_type:complete
LAILSDILNMSSTDLSFMTSSYSFLAKILGMTSSSNANERKVAEEKLQEQLIKYGLTKEELERKINSSDLDDSLTEPTTWKWINRDGKIYWNRVNPSEAIILNAVARYFNGRVVNCRDHLEVFATKGNSLQVNLYTEYLLDALDRALIAERSKYSTGFRFRRDFNTSFRKGWATEVHQRLDQMKKEEEKQGKTIQINNESVNQSAMVVRGKNEIEQSKALSLRDKVYPRLRSGSGFTRGGSGRDAGRASGSQVGLGKQVSGRSALRLSGS